MSQINKAGSSLIKYNASQKNKTKLKMEYEQLKGQGRCKEEAGWRQGGGRGVTLRTCMNFNAKLTKIEGTKGGIIRRC